MLPGLLERWGIAGAYDHMVRTWLSIEPLETTHALLRSLREAGVRCYLATNQAQQRGEHMRDVLGYGGLFDGSFYSYEMGVAKPDPGYFRHIVQRLDIEPETALFLDDRLDNVLSARSVGLRAEVWSYREDLAVLRDHLRRHGVPLPHPAGVGDPGADGRGPQPSSGSSGVA